MLTARYLVAGEQTETSGLVAAAVRAAGYVSEEVEGSCVEEEEEGEDDDKYLYAPVDHPGEDAMHTHSYTPRKSIRN
jgi:hypothetical protein